MPPNSPPSVLRLSPWILAALLFGLTLLGYWPALRGGLVWDDAAHVTRPELQSLAGLARIWSDPHATQQYYPVLHSAFWIEHRLWGDATFGYHLATVLWHALSACLFALALRRLWTPAVSEDPIRAGLPDGSEWVAAFLFAVHPVGVESVAWISEQKNTLSLVFYLSSVLAYLDFDSRRQTRSYGLALGFFLLALATKSVTATLPGALLVMLWYRHGSLQWRRDIVPLLPWFGVALAAGLFTAWVERTLIGAQGASFDLTAGQRLLLAGRIVWFYLGKLAWPTDLIFIYPHWDVNVEAAGWYGWLLGAFALTAGLWFIRHRARGPLAAWLFFVGSLFPALGFFNVYPFLFSYVADHFQYLASLAVFASVAGGLAILFRRARRPARIAAKIIFPAGVAMLVMLTYRQSGNYRDSETLYRATLEKNPACWMAYNNLGAGLAKSPARVGEAIALYRAALALRPDYPEALNNLGNALAVQPGGLDAAIRDFSRALELVPGFIEARLNLANALAKIPQRFSEAIAAYQEVLRLDPQNPEGHYCFANTLATQPDRRIEARQEYEQTLRLQPDYAEAHANLAGLLAHSAADLPAALAHFETSLRLKPELARTHYNFANLLGALPGREADAIAQYAAALRLDPAFAEAHNNLAILDANAGRFEDARQHWLTALKLNPTYEDARKNMERLDRMKQP